MAYNPNEPRDASGKWTNFDAKDAIIKAASDKKRTGIIEEVTKKGIELTKQDFPGKENIEFVEWGLGGKGRWKAVDKKTKKVIGIGHTKEEAMFDSNQEYFINKVLDSMKF